MNPDDEDAFISDDFHVLVGRSQNAAIAELDRHFENERDFRENAAAQANALTMSALLRAMDDSLEKKQAALDAAEIKIQREADAVVKQKEQEIKSDEPTDRFPDPIFTDKA